MKLLNWLIPSFIFVVHTNLWASQSSSGSNLQIIEANGSFDIFTIGSYPQSPACLEQIGKNIYISGSSPAVIFTNEAGQIQEIAVTGPGIFTQRYVTIGQSTLRDVLKRYGSGMIFTWTSFDLKGLKGDLIVLAYTNLIFFFDPSQLPKLTLLPPKPGGDEELSLPVKAITLWRGPTDLHSPFSKSRFSPLSLQIFSKEVSQPSRQCDVTLWSHVYHPQRLIVSQQCACVTGTIVDATNGRLPDGVRREADGDAHGWLQVDSEFENLLNDANMATQGGNLVFEIICRYPVRQADAMAPCQGYSDQVTLPPVGSHVRIVGTYVEDSIRNHWMEIHPVTSITVIP